MSTAGSLDEQTSFGEGESCNSFVVSGAILLQLLLNPFVLFGKLEVLDAATTQAATPQTVTGQRWRGDVNSEQLLAPRET